MGSISPEHDFEVLVIGAGISGIYMLYKLRELNISARVLEAGSGVGGTWYWNRYPGARFDSESWTYGYSFSKDVLKEWDWKEHFAPQAETESYLNFVVDKFKLRDGIQFQSRVRSAHYDQARNQWKVTTESGEVFSAHFLVTAIGALTNPVLPRIPGIPNFKGAWSHTGLWPKEGIDYAGKRVAVIGTGATGIQTIQEVAKSAVTLTVFQRRPNWCSPLGNRKIDAEEMESIRARYDEIFSICKTTPGCFIHQFDSRSVFDVSPEEREAFWEKHYHEPGFGLWMGNFRDVYTDKKANALLSEFVAKKIRERVKDPKVAEKLIPKDHGFGTRRVPLETRYLEVYNQENVELVDLNEEPIERITEKGIKTSKQEREFDVIIYATGFDPVTGSFNAIDIVGVDGQRLKELWAPGPKTQLGFLVSGFPNMLMAMGPHSALGNFPRSIEYSVEWIADLLGYARDNGVSVIEATEQGQKAWTEHVRTCSDGLLVNDVDSWITGVNSNVDGKKTRTLVIYNGSAVDYRARCDEVARERYKELSLKP
ncbi:hypothetical protein AYO21_03781 [Fonsecaea monophora]|uniref:FAD/NAD(P)-binding domain-containing protein n=1 Tax=Fonsecaea monophora TaxID=254056 RepID=A0A177FE62_9EURO|nr:hypothetical protein AYO21_03781 [Fonsecaea monophora]KAH0828222.1 2-oxo-Delta(3)-4,5,5-trimethylcyclopentenylacetyl-CoA monooxygenase [Fonsecaea pedrosoi]OAG42046.1 hypothetical protein AYO21_03781 [Fonsecaea monophora]